MYGLIIKKKWLDLIMSGKKTLEICGCRTSHVGEEIAFLESGSQKIRGFCTIKEVMALDKGKWEVYRDLHCVDVSWENLIKRYKTPYAWHLSAITPKEGLTYEHPKGAVIWVNLDYAPVFKEVNLNEKKDDATTLIDTGDYVTTAYGSMDYYKCTVCGYDEILNYDNFCPPLRTKSY